MGFFYFGEIMAYKNKEDRQKYQKEYYKEYKANNKEKLRVKNQKLYTLHKNQGLCVICGKKPVFENLTQCEDCKNRRKILSKKRTQKGLCTRCGKPKVEGKIICKDCSNKNCEKRKTRKEAGICHSCGKVAIKNKSRCAECFMKAMAKRVGTTTEILKEIWNKQNGVCAYSGRKLIIGVNVSVDHKIPKSKGGNNDPSNLQFVHRMINVAKYNLLESEFFQLIKDCHDYIN
jgi:5-methylcytosine-specific restriction endonuclease McrA